MKICIVGGVAGGASAATRLRRLSEDADIVLFEKGDYISYANCGLPYYIGGAIQEKLAAGGGFLFSGSDAYVLPIPWKM